jgi:D-amino-acid dehydrogenase
MRIAVIGAGIVGSACAFFLAPDGHEVTLIDPLPPGAGTSSGNAGIISLGSLSPVVTPALLASLPRLLTQRDGPLAIRWRYLPQLLPWLGRAALASRRADAIAAALGRLLAQADAAHDEVISGAGLQDLVRPGGWLKVARSENYLLRHTEFDRRLLKQAGVAFELLDAASVHALEPGLAPDLVAGLHLPRNRAVRNPQRYAEGIAKAAQARGGHWMQAEATGFTIDGARITAIRTSRGKVEVDAAVLAAGAFAKKLAAQAGVRVPLEAERGYHLMLRPPVPGLSRTIYSIEDGFVLAPMEDGLRLTGGVELASPTAPPDYRRTRRLAAKARRILPTLDPRPLSEWQGCRPSLPDSLPVLGRAPDRPNLLLAFGHQHIGLTLGPLTGRIIADLVAGRDPGIDLRAYAADRRFF